MPQSLRCPECRRSFAPRPVDADRQRVPCPDCGALVANPTWDDPDESDDRRRDEYDDYDDRPRRRPARQSSGVKTVLIVLGALGLVVLVCCGGLGGLFWWAIKPTDFPDQTQDYADARKGFQTTLTQKGESPQPWDPQTPPAGVQELQYQSGGLTLTAWVDGPAKRPAGGPLKPAVLYLHSGFAFAKEDWEEAKPFRDAGFVTMVPILRGENGQPGNFTLFYDEVDDAVAAGEALAKTPGVDPNRIYVAGHSAGGTLAMLAAMTSKRFKACASLAGSPDQGKFLQYEPVDPPFDPENAREIEMRSPLAYPKSFKCPVRVYYGDEEGPVASKAARRLADKARAAGLDVQAVEVRGDHMAMRDPALKLAVAFFQSK
jgi:dienelactone hydrolase